jgi:plasmid maintenance system antidote protein VapI
MKRLKNIQPGEILQEEFLIPFGLSAYKLSNYPRTLGFHRPEFLRF